MPYETTYEPVQNSSKDWVIKRSQSFRFGRDIMYIGERTWSMGHEDIQLVGMDSAKVMKFKLKHQAEDFARFLRIPFDKSLRHKDFR